MYLLHMTEGVDTHMLHMTEVFKYKYEARCQPGMV